MTVHTLVREDIFAGFLQNDLVRLARAEKNIELLLASRPADRPALLAWQGGTALTRAVNANEAKQSDQFRQQYLRAQDLFTEAMKLGPEDVGVFAITGGSQVDVGRSAAGGGSARPAWELSYTAYQQLWKLQGQVIEKLPLHHKGEVLSGLAQSAQRTGRIDEATAQLDRILTLMPDTAYANRARQWKDDPSARSNRLACQTCHAPGTLVSRLADVSKQ